MTTELTKAAQQDITERLRKDKWHITGVDAEEAAQLIEELREQLAKAKADERHIYEAYSRCADERSALTQRPAAQTERDTGPRVLREVFALCEDTMDKMAAESTEFSRGRAFEDKGISRAIGTWFQDEYCGRSHMGEPSLPAPQQATPATPDDMKVYDGIAAGYFADTQQATPEPDVARLVASIKDDAKHAAYLAEIDNTDGRDKYLHKLSLSLDDLASRVHQQATPEPVPRSVFIAGNETAMCAFAARDLAERYVSNFGGATAGGMTVVELPVVGATPEPVGEPVANEFFACDAEGGIAFYKTQQEAIDHAKESLNYYLDGANAHGEWEEDVEQIRWGVVMQRAQATNVSATEDGESSCEYELQDLATRPAPGVPEGWREVIEKMVKGIDHLAELARQWEPDYSSGADRKGWVLAKNARDEAVDMLAAAQAKGGAA